MKNLALTLPGYENPIETPNNIPSGVNSSGDIVSVVFSILLILVIVSALIFTLYGGVLWASSGGDKQKIDKARRTIMFSIIGLIVAVLSFIIVQTIGAVLGVSYLSNIGK